MKNRYFLFIAYKGTAYHGWQIQPNGISVQEVLAGALTTVLREEIEVVGAGRTDAGVHAKLMVAHFDCSTKIESSTTPSLTSLPNKLNSILPPDIAVSKMLAVKKDAHARFDAQTRKYEYHIVNYKHVFKTELAARFTHPLNLERMNEAAACLLEYSDFTSFSKLHTDAKTNNCVIHIAWWTHSAGEWVFTIQADRFLRNMVRAIVGTLLEVGRNKMTVAQFRAVIEAKNRCKAGVSVPAQGLYLVDIEYPDTIFEV